MAPEAVGEVLDVIRLEIEEAFKYAQTSPVPADDEIETHLYAGVRPS